jgi:hypothetical protein
LEFKVVDPQGALASLAFAKSDGTLLQPSLFLGPNTINSRSTIDSLEYDFNQPLPADLRLVVHLATPQTSQTVRYKLENIHLPWVDFPAVQVTTSDVTWEQATSTNTSAYHMQLTFMGGEVGRSSGIRKLSVIHAEGDNGQAFKINEKSIFWSQNDHVAALLNVGLPGRRGVKSLPLETSPPGVHAIRLLEGEAELFNPSTKNGGLLEFDDFTAHPGAALNNQALSLCGVKLSFLGRVNAEAKRKEWSKERDLLMEGRPSRNAAETVNDSLMFSVEDPENRIVSMEFFDKKGRLFPAGRMVTWAKPSKPHNDVQVYFFEQPPAADCLLRIKLATPESLQPIKFKLENIPLPL